MNLNEKTPYSKTAIAILCSKIFFLATSSQSLKFKLLLHSCIVVKIKDPKGKQG